MTCWLTSGVVGIWYLAGWALNKVAAMLKVIFSNVFFFKKTFIFWFKLYWGVFWRVRLTVSLHWFMPWWCHEMETFSALLALCAGNSLAASEIPSQRPVSRSFDIFFDLRLNKWLCKQSRRWWFGMPACSLWRHCNSSGLMPNRWQAITWTSVDKMPDNECLHYAKMSQGWYWRELTLLQ